MMAETIGLEVCLKEIDQQFALQQIFANDVKDRGGIEEGVIGMALEAHPWGPSTRKRKAFSKFRGVGTLTAQFSQHQK
jgi:hypothetical protein